MKIAADDLQKLFDSRRNQNLATSSMQQPPSQRLWIPSNPHNQKHLRNNFETSYENHNNREERCEQAPKRSVSWEHFDSAYDTCGSDGTDKLTDAPKRRIARENFDSSTLGAYSRNRIHELSNQPQARILRDDFDSTIGAHSGRDRKWQNDERDDSNMEIADVWNECSGDNVDRRSNGKNVGLDTQPISIPTQFSMTLPLDSTSLNHSNSPDNIEMDCKDNNINTYLRYSKKQSTPSKSTSAMQTMDNIFKESLQTKENKYICKDETRIAENEHGEMQSTSSDPDIDMNIASDLTRKPMHFLELLEQNKESSCKDKNSKRKSSLANNTNNQQSPTTFHPNVDSASTSGQISLKRKILKDYLEDESLKSPKTSMIESPGQKTNPFDRTELESEKSSMDKQQANRSEITLVERSVQSSSHTIGKCLQITSNNSPNSTTRKARSQTVSTQTTNEEHQRYRYLFQLTMYFHPTNE